MTKTKYLNFKNKKCPHCDKNIDIEVFYEVMDRFQVDFETRIKKSKEAQNEPKVN